MAGSCDGGRDGRARLPAARLREDDGAEAAERDQAENRGGQGQRAGREPGERAAGHTPRRRARPDRAHGTARGVGVEPLVDERPEARDQRPAERGDVQVEEHRGRAREEKPERPPAGEEKGGEGRGRGDDAGGRAARLQAGKGLGAGERRDRGGPHHERQRLHAEGGEEDRVPDRARRDLLRDEKPRRERGGGDGSSIGGIDSGEAHRSPAAQWVWNERIY